MARKNYSIDGVLKSLSRKKDVKVLLNTIYVLADTITVNGVSVPNPEKIHDLGNGSLGKIDFLVHYEGFHVNHIGSFRGLRL